ncbi:MAG: lipid A deacylase LpxR family protein [Sedimentisphaerales bacterium]
MNDIESMAIKLIRVMNIKGQKAKSGLIIAISAMTICLLPVISTKADSASSPQADSGGSTTAGQTFTFYLENDGTFLKPEHRTDRHYTSGLKLVYTDQPDCNALKEFAKWNNFASENEKVNTAVGYFLGQDIFTPDHADNPELRAPHDRVFAGWLYVGMFAQRATEDQMEHFELNLGVIGPSSLGEESQETVHQIVGANKPRGWVNQLSDEFAADFTYFKRQRADAITFKHTENFDSHVEYGFTASSVHRNAILGILFRGGINLPNDFGPGRLEAPACATDKSRDDLTHLYLFSRLGGKLVEYDRFLTGLSEKPLVGVIQVGLGWRYKSFELTYSQTFLTREYDEQPDGDSFGSLTLSYRF